MKMNKCYYLSGFMGVGKSTILKKIKERTQLSCIDLDASIEEKHGPINEIFKINGEKFFREFEEKITLDILKKKRIIVALGGGAFINKNIKKEILKNHQSFWLKLNSEMLIKRIKTSIKRPLAYNIPNADLKNMIKDRTKYYEKALFKIDCNNLTKKQIVDKVVEIYETN